MNVQQKVNAFFFGLGLPLTFNMVMWPLVGYLAWREFLHD